MWWGAQIWGWGGEKDAPKEVTITVRLNGRKGKLGRGGGRGRVQAEGEAPAKAVQQDETGLLRN